MKKYNVDMLTTDPMFIPESVKIAYSWKVEGEECDFITIPFSLQMECGLQIC
jgi:hypothetical protein